MFVVQIHKGLKVRTGLVWLAYQWEGTEVRPYWSSPTTGGLWHNPEKEENIHESQNMKNCVLHVGFGHSFGFQEEPPGSLKWRSEGLGGRSQH